MLLQCNSGAPLRLGISSFSHVQYGTALSRTPRSSRDQYAMSLPLLYCHVDISIHSTEDLLGSYLLDCTVDSRSPNRYLMPSDFERLQSRQEVFIDAIIKTPSLGALVLSLTWTYWWYEEKSMEVDEKQQMMWTAFKLSRRLCFL